MDASKLYLTTVLGAAYTETDAVRKQAEAVQDETSQDPKVNDAADAVVRGALAMVDSVDAMRNALDPSTTWSQGPDLATRLNQSTSGLPSLEKELLAACPN